MIKRKVPSSIEANYCIIVKWFFLPQRTDLPHFRHSVTDNKFPKKVNGQRKMFHKPFRPSRYVFQCFIAYLIVALMLRFAIQCRHSNIPINYMDDGPSTPTACQCFFVSFSHYGCFFIRSTF